ncbi:helix-turn-helix domain-containing protein [Nitratireductor mangrovi]|uniref:Helix-turn-helix domain-containing protein n=1 Tax=Nitratireductor mangrovi TaxID=2599600 RepID=A0A5B8L0R6_9HYPH|nr:XRE family transcriptional regulator [Nitratireductor mangrovi]QDZ01302.1 helix-turn-helix domain-containing protein [Nitratireductor mangrovi]
MARARSPNAQVHPAGPAGTLGSRLRELRHEKGFSIAQLAALASVPSSTISKIENGLLNPSLVNAINLASALDANLGFLVDRARARHARYAIVRRSQRGRSSFPEMALILEDLNIGFVPGLLEARIGTISPGAHSGKEYMTHPGDEMAHILSGTLDYDIDGEGFVLSSGDSLHFKSHVPHRWMNRSDEPAEVLWIFSDGLSF